MLVLVPCVTCGGFECLLCLLLDLLWCLMFWIACCVLGIFVSFVVVLVCSVLFDWFCDFGGFVCFDISVYLVVLVFSVCLVLLSWLLHVYLILARCLFWFWSCFLANGFEFGVFCTLLVIFVLLLGLNLFVLGLGVVLC